MNLLKRPEAPPTEHIHSIKEWVNELLRLRGRVPISISQLRCHEPDCPPVETIISVMTQPPRTYKIHKPATEIDFDVVLIAIKASDS